MHVKLQLEFRVKNGYAFNDISNGSSIKVVKCFNFRNQRKYILMTLARIVR